MQARIASEQREMQTKVNETQEAVGNVMNTIDLLPLKKEVGVQLKRLSGQMVSSTQELISVFCVIAMNLSLRSEIVIYL